MTSQQRSNYQGVSFFTLFVLLIFLCLYSIQVNAASTPGELLGLGTKAQQEGRLDEALKYFKAVPVPHDNEDTGTYVRARMEAAKIYFSREEYSKSADICREVVGLYPDNIEANNLKSQVDAASTPKWLKFLKDMKTYLPTLLKASVMTLILVFMTMLISPLGGLLRRWAGSAE